MRSIAFGLMLPAALLAGLVGATAPAAAERLVSSLSNHRVMVTSNFTGDEVEAWALLVYGQTGDRTSPLFDSQTIEFSEKQWRQVAYTDAQIEADPDLETYAVVGR